MKRTGLFALLLLPLLIAGFATLSAEEPIQQYLLDPNGNPSEVLATVWEGDLWKYEATSGAYNGEYVQIEYNGTWLITRSSNWPGLGAFDLEVNWCSSCEGCDSDHTPEWQGPLKSCADCSSGYTDCLTCSSHREAEDGYSHSAYLAEQKGCKNAFCYVWGLYCKE